MNFTGDLRFWIMVFAIVLLGTLGGILFKYGTNELGTISIEKMLGIKISKTVLLYGALMVGGFLLFIFGGISLRNDLFAMNYLFSPIIFISLALMFLSRFLVGIPLSTTELGKLTAITTSLLILFTSIAGIMVFKEKINTRVWAGIGFGIISIILLSGE